MQPTKIASCPPGGSALGGGVPASAPVAGADQVAYLLHVSVRPGCNFANAEQASAMAMGYATRSPTAGVVPGMWRISGRTSEHLTKYRASHWVSRLRGGRREGSGFPSVRQGRFGQSVVLTSLGRHSDRKYIGSFQQPNPFAVNLPLYVDVEIKTCICWKPGLVAHLPGSSGVDKHTMTSVGCAAPVQVVGFSVDVTDLAPPGSMTSCGGVMA